MPNLIATCLFGLEGVLADEIDALGYRRGESMDGRVSFTVPDMSGVCRANINLRVAERVYITLGDFVAPTFDALYEGTKALPWEAYVGKNDAFPVKGHSIKSALTSLPSCQSIIKKAVVDRLSAAYRSALPEIGVKIQIEFFLFKDKATLMIDTSGAPLHKRGYRPASNLAPLRETLAAGLVALSRPREDVLFWDPMCGSGTIAVEAALRMSSTVPGIVCGRPYAAEEFAFVPKPLWDKARDEAKSAVKFDSAFEAYASDIDPEAVEIAKDNIARAGMGKFIKCFRRDALTIATDGRRGTIVTNPPYGERLLSMKDADALYRAMGRHFATLDRWQIYVLCESQEFERLFSRRADKKRKLYNGMIPCTFYEYYKKTAPV